VLDVPFLAQTESLCGGAAAAMVLRYWDAPDIQAGDFPPDDTKGITTGALVGALTARGWQALPFHGDAASVRDHLRRGRPVIALVAVAPGRNHYVVLVGWANGRVLLHDPAEGPFRVRGERELIAAWDATARWSLLILPPAGGAAAHAPSPPPEGPAPGGPCARLVARGIEEARGGDLAAAEASLAGAAALCPDDGASYRELAGVRFKQDQWREAAALAQRAVAAQPADDLAWRLLATSRFLAGDVDGALRAWNEVGAPRLDRLLVAGLDRTRVQVVTDRVALEPRGVLSADRVARARRRLAELPSLSAARLSVEPLGDGRAELRAAVVERSLVATPVALALQTSVDVLSQSTTRLRLASLAHAGEAVEIGGRWGRSRPAGWVTLAQPRALALPGTVTAVAMWDVQTYATPGTPAVREVRRGVSLSAAEWWTADFKTVMKAGIDRFGRGTHMSAGTELERRLAADRIALAGGAMLWAPLGGDRWFGTGTVRLAARTSARPHRFVLEAALGGHAASARAPRALWPGAGTGDGRPPLLRAHPLLDDGVVVGEAFGRRLAHGTIEAEAQLVRLGPVAVTAAAFLDGARAWARPGGDASGSTLLDGGVGLRLALPAAGTVRLDIAKALRDGRGPTVSGSWVSPWPH